MPGISVALICRNEEKNLSAWLESVRAFADQVVAVDSGSGDATVEILEGSGALVRRREWTGYADQRNYAASLCEEDWILFLDADELVDQKLALALNDLKSREETGVAGYELSFKVFFFGRFLRHGGFFPERHLRLTRRGRGEWIKRQVHERLEVRGPVGSLPGYVEHYSYSNVGEYLRRMDTYSLQAALHMHESGRRTSSWDVWFHAWWNFANRYLFRLGFLDGYQGYLAARMESLYTLTKYARLMELARGMEKRDEG